MSKKLKKRVTGLICLATPFLHFYQTAQETKWLFALSGIVALPLLILAIMGILKGAFSLHPITYVVVVISALLAVIYLAHKLRKAGFRLPLRNLLKVMFKTDIKDWTERLKLPEFESEKLLIVRSVADEASGLLTSAQFAAWVGGQIWRTLGRIWRFVPPTIAVFGLVGGGAGFFLTEARADLYGDIVSLAVGLAMFAIGAVALVVLFLVALANAPFGYDALALSFRGQTAAADSPLGKALVVQLALSGFRHSEIYKADIAIEEVEAFIQSMGKVGSGNPAEKSE